MKSVTKTLLLATAVVAAPLDVAAKAVAEGETQVLVSHAPDSDTLCITIKNDIALPGSAPRVRA